MTYQGDFTLPPELLERIASEGFDILPELIQIVINEAMQAERQQHLNGGRADGSWSRRRGRRQEWIRWRVGRRQHFSGRPAFIP
jgi:hypothetical protein